MSRKNLIVAIIACSVVALAVFLLARSTDPAADPLMTDNPVDPAQSAMVDDASFASPVDRSARWGFILFDDVKMDQETLGTGDQVYIGETDAAHPNQTKVTLFDGKGGWVDDSKVFEATTFAPWSILDTSTAPLKDWIPEELVPPANMPQYKVITSSDFLMRASKNSHPTIAEWAQAVLAAQAERAAQ